MPTSVPDHTTRPRLKAPIGACDTHMHFYDDRFPASEKAWLFPPSFLPADYARVQERLGLERMVVVQPVTYGFDNRCILDAVARAGDAARAVVTVPLTVSDAELDAYWKGGARGLRFHQMRGGMLTWEELQAMAGRIVGSGWHVQVQLDGMELPEREALIAALPCTVVIDHFGRYSQPVGPKHPAVQALLRLTARPNVWVKLSGAYHISTSGAPQYADVADLAKAVAAVGTERLLWGSDWPHPTHLGDDRPDDAELMDLLLDWVPSAAERDAILSRNPARLYGFSPK
ncbi:MAG: amidohydrolase family protein [Rhodobacteraceae bacterium]|nr:amidohydrolase family protein [Paracoccaceae bacterium]